MMVHDGVALTFSGHNIVLPDGTQTRRGAEPVADGSICRAALRDLALAFSGVPRSSVRVADLGCLEGGYTAAFAKAGYDATGFEARADNFLCCQYVAGKTALPNLRFVQADVRDVFAQPQDWDAVFCCGLLYHLDNPVAFLNQLGRSVRRLLILQTHFSVHPEVEHEGRSGHWYTEGSGRWSSWGNAQSFWLEKNDLLAAVRDAGFNTVFEQVDYRGNMSEGSAFERSMFVGLKVDE